MSTLRRTGLIETWHDRAIDAGSEWKQQIDEHLNEVDIVLLLLSADFVASDYCHNIEMVRALERHRTGDASVVPIVLHPFDFTGLPIADLQMLPPNAYPISMYSNRDVAFSEVAKGIRSVVDEIRLQRVVQFRDKTGSDWLPQARVLDACIAPEIPRAESREVTALVRLAGSERLRFIIEQDLTPNKEEVSGQRSNRVFSAGIDDVRSTPFAIGLPVSAQGVVGFVVVRLRVNSPDFEPPIQEKKIMLPKMGDSQAFQFLLRTYREGEHVLSVELLCDDVVVVEQLLRTRTAEHGGGGPGVVSSGTAPLGVVPLRVMCVAKAAVSGN